MYHARGVHLSFASEYLRARRPQRRWPAGACASNLSPRRHAGCTGLPCTYAQAHLVVGTSDGSDSLRCYCPARWVSWAPRGSGAGDHAAYHVGSGSIGLSDAPRRSECRAQRNALGAWSTQGGLAAALHLHLVLGTVVPKGTFLQGYGHSRTVHGPLTLRGKAHQKVFIAANPLRPSRKSRL
eukprot:scaffold3749_cov457-Prasinococcus_capsulatus_cf.AAC.4